MKAITSAENTSAYSGGAAIYSSSAKITKHKRDVENEEIQAYLSKLKELVPFMPKNRRLSKLEVIQYVIDYICDLQRALETHPTISSVAVHSAAAAAVMLSSASQAGALNLQNMLGDATAAHHRQPLAILAPNTNTKTLAIPNHNHNTCSGSGSATTASVLESSSMSPSSRRNEKLSYSSESGKSVAC